MSTRAKILTVTLLCVSAFILGSILFHSGTPLVPYPADAQSAANVEEGIDRILSLPLPREAVEERSPLGTEELANSRGGPKGSEPVDDGWDKLIRNKRPMLSFFLEAESDGKVQTELLFRNRALNLRDIPIKRAARDELAPALRDVVYRLHRVGKMERDYHASYGRSLIESGVVQPMKKLPEASDAQLDIIRKDLTTRLSRNEKAAAEEAKAQEFGDKSAVDASYKGSQDRATKIAKLRELLANPRKAAGSYYFVPNRTWSQLNEKGLFQLHIDRFPSQLQIDMLKAYLREEFAGLLINYFESKGTLVREAKQMLLKPYIQDR